MKTIEIMGVINANEDSFFKDSRFQGQNAILKIEDMIEHGASIIDLGAVSSRPGSLEVKEEEELKRLKDIFDLIKNKKLYEKVQFSIDSYTPSVLKYAFDCGFSIINDITGLQNDEVCSLAASYKSKVVIMHMQNKPNDMQDKPSYQDILKDIEEFFKQRIKKAKSFGIDDIVLDIGIGFGKTLEHNLKLLHNLDKFSSLGYALLVGASRKSLINEIVKSELKDRLPGTLAIHLEAINKGASIIRCHDVKEHFQAIKVQEGIRKAI